MGFMGLGNGPYGSHGLGIVAPGTCTMYSTVSGPRGARFWAHIVRLRKENCAISTK